MSNKIWILNIDDFIFKAKARDALKKHTLTYLQVLKSGDMCVISPLAQKDAAFTNYMAEIKKLTNKKWLFSPKKQSAQDTLVGSIIKDKTLVAQIKKLCKQGYVLIPLLYTEEFAKLSKLCGNTLLNNSIAVQEANNKLLFKKLCKEFAIRTMQPVFEKRTGKDKSRILGFIDFNETYLLRRPFSAGGYGNVKGKIIDLLPLLKQYHKDGDFFIEKFREIYKTLGSLCTLKEDGVKFIGIDCQFVHKEGAEGRYYPFKKLDKKILQRIEEKSLQMAQYYHKKGVRGQVNFDWAIRIKDGEFKLRALECNSRYNGFSLGLRMASTVFDLPRDKTCFYLDTNIEIGEDYSTQKLIEVIKLVNSNLPFKGGIVMTNPVKDGRTGVCFVATSPKNVQLLRLFFKKNVA